MLASHMDAEKRYSQLRKEALNATTQVLGNVSNITLSEINVRALSASKLWENSNIRIKDWDWIEGYTAFKFRYPKRFEMALWSANQLIGLSIHGTAYISRDSTCSGQVFLERI